MKKRVLMVCLGNICRSPLAEGILKSKVDPGNVEVDSAGTAGYHVGNPPDPRSVEEARKNQIDISGQRCRKFQREDFFEFDHIFVMDKDNYRDVSALAPDENHRKKVRLLSEGIPSLPTEVPDPYYGGQDGFKNVFKLIDEACEKLASEL
ncbi:low molecular weight protein-tyrosine-phosphatase [Muriicola soli]|uniref:protein-tyrosine-phosphatase n=1 Tax=Muriicola soli TaxID=2507538 RepID=A0A411EA14_9FLAO|nr:low molecular weight protein-tyrosine-phosphatase [Muriicola soli]QBA64387.1 low molecular weight phosphotyrosine protein phosphatase [Muriicola soli]